jgi:hypothetical protein
MYDEGGGLMSVHIFIFVQKIKDRKINLPARLSVF